GRATLKESLLPTSIPGLKLLPAPLDAVDPGLWLRAGVKAKWIAQLRALPTDYVVIDAGPGHGLFALDVMNLADVAVAVTVPEPPAIETTYRFLRAAFRRRMRRTIRADRFRSGLLQRAIRQLGALPPPVDLVVALAKMDPALGELAWNEAHK